MKRNEQLDEQHEHRYIKKVEFLDKDFVNVELDSITACNIKSVIDVSLVLVHQKDNSNENVNEDELIKMKYVIAIYGDIEVKSKNEDDAVNARAVYIKLNYFLDEEEEEENDCLKFNTFTRLKIYLRDFVKLFHEFLLMFYQSKPLFDIYLKPIDIKSFCIYFLTQHPNEPDIQNAFEKELNNMIRNIDNNENDTIKQYIEFIIKHLNKSEMFQEGISLTLKNYQRKFRQCQEWFQNYSLLNDTENLCDILNYLVLCNNESKNVPSIEDAFYNLLLKINDFYKKKFFFCCGTSDEINYSKSPYVFCFDCKKLICVKCFTFHRTHYYFDFCCIIKYKHANIHSTLSNFSNYSEKKDTQSHSSKQDENKNKDKNNESKKPVEDPVLKKLIGKFQETKSRQILQRFSVFDAVDLFLKEHLIKMIPLIKSKFENEKMKFINTYLSNNNINNVHQRKENNNAYKELIQNVINKLKRKNVNQNKVINNASPFEDIINVIIEPTNKQQQQRTDNQGESSITNETIWERIDLEKVIEKKSNDNKDVSLYENLLEHTKNKGVYIDGFGSLFDFVMLYLERVYDEMLNFGNQYYPFN